MTAPLHLAADDAKIRQGLEAMLLSEGYAVTPAANGALALKLFERGKFDLVILDVMMPQLSGYDTCRELRRRGATVPVLFLTAKSEEIDKVVGFKLGADDYVTKPFGVHELLARVEALLRRARPAAADPAAAAAPVFRLGGAEIDRRKYTVTHGGRTSALTALELKLAEALAARPGEVLTREFLLNTVWGVDYFGTTRTLDQHVAQLRKKVEDDPEHPLTIVTIHGVGYRYGT